MLPELTQTQHDFQEQTGHEQLCFGFAGASGSRVGPSRKAQKKKENMFDGPVFGGSISEVILKLSMHPKFHRDSLWAP